MSSWMHRLCLRAIVLIVAANAISAFAQTSAAPKSPAKDKKTAQTQAATSAPKKRVVIDLSGFDLLEAKKVEKQAVVAGATRGMPAPVALAPRLAGLYGSTPVFAWRYDGKVEKFEVVVRDDQDNEIFREATKEHVYTYPGSPNLAAGRTYFWTVEITEPALLSSLSEPVGFVVVSDAQRDQIARSLQGHSGDGYEAAKARAQLMVDNRLWYDAVAAYSELIEKFPDRPELPEKRADVYAQLPVTQTLAKQDYAHADALKMKAQNK